MKTAVSVTTLLKNPLAWAVITFLVFLFVTDTALAAGEGGSAQGLPWEGPMEMLKNSISGPIAFVIALLGIIACGATLIWGGEISEFTRRIIYVVLVICLIVFANSMLGTLFGTQGAVIPDVTTLPAEVFGYAGADAGASR